MEDGGICCNHPGDIIINAPKSGITVAIGEKIEVFVDGKSGPVRRIQPGHGNIHGRIGQFLFTDVGQRIFRLSHRSLRHIDRSAQLICCRLNSDLLLQQMRFLLRETLPVTDIVRKCL